MSDGTKTPGAAVSAQDARAARRKAELRANMARRKVQARLRAAGGDEAGGSDAPGSAGAGADDSKE
jgi:hypothetical protein